MARLTNSVEATMSAEDIKFLVSTSVEGKDSITTSTGYTFDKDGMRVSKSGEEMENIVDYKGMYVNRGGDNVLTADHKGVNAINLTAREHLTVVETARFEKYAQKRVACFYIGG